MAFNEPHIASIEEVNAEFDAMTEKYAAQPYFAFPQALV
jgi:hypothetical protein